MGVAISKLSVIIEGSTSGLEAILSKGEHAVHGFEAEIEHAGSHIGEILGAVGLGLSIEGITEYLKSTFETITATERLASVLDVSTASLQRMHYAASLVGVENDAVDAGLRKLEKSLYDANAAGGESAQAFQSLGLNARELANLPVDQAMARITEALGKTGNAAQRNGAAAEIFGRNYASLLPLLREGSGFLSESGEEADRFHVALSDIDVAKVAEAEKAINRVKGAIQGAANTVVVELSPYLDAAADRIAIFATTGQGATGLVTRGMGYLAEGVATAADYLELLEAGYDKLVAAGGYWIDAALQGIDKLAHAIDWVDRKFGGKGLDLSFLDNFTRAVDAQIDELNKRSGQHWEDFMEGKGRKAAHALFQDIQSQSEKAAEKVAAGAKHMGDAFGDGFGAAADKVTQKLDEMRRKVEEFGKSAGEQAALEVKALGGSAIQQSQASAYADELEALEKNKKAHEDLAEAAKKTFEETRTPAEKYAEQLEKINDEVKAGLIDRETADRAKAKAQADALKDKENNQFGPQALEAGSAAAAKFVAEIQARQSGARDMEERRLRLQQRANELLARMADRKPIEAPEVNVISYPGAGASA